MGSVDTDESVDIDIKFVENKVGEDVETYPAFHYGHFKEGEEINFTSGKRKEFPFKLAKGELFFEENGSPFKPLDPVDPSDLLGKPLKLPSDMCLKIKGGVAGDEVKTFKCRLNRKGRPCIIRVDKKTSKHDFPHTGVCFRLFEVKNKKNDWVTSVNMIVQIPPAGLKHVRIRNCFDGSRMSFRLSLGGRRVGVVLEKKGGSGDQVTLDKHLIKNAGSLWLDDLCAIDLKTQSGGTDHVQIFIDGTST